MDKITQDYKSMAGWTKMIKTKTKFGTTFFVWLKEHLQPSRTLPFLLAGILVYWCKALDMRNIYIGKGILRR